MSLPLIFKGVRVEAIRVVKNNGLPFPPVLKIEFCAVFRGDGAHRIPLIVELYSLVIRSCSQERTYSGSTAKKGGSISARLIGRLYARSLCLASSF
jgi:hypothetical protein